MRLSVDHIFGPKEYGTAVASEALTRFLRMVHANWNEASRERALHLVRHEVRPIAEQLGEIHLTPTDCYDLSELHVFGLDARIVFNPQMLPEDIDTLREALPLSDTFDLPLRALDLEVLQHDLPAMAALKAFHNLLLRTDFWDAELEGVDLATMGIFAVLDPHLCTRTEPDVFAAEFKELTDRTGIGEFHVLDVLSRLFNDRYLVAGLRAGVITLLHERVLSEPK